MRSAPPSGYIRIGRLGKSFKLAGGVRLWLESADAAGRLDELGRLFVAGFGDTRLRDHEVVSGSLVVYLEGVRDRTAARSLVNAEVWAETSGLTSDTLELLEEPAEDVLLVGLDVRLAGARVGQITGAELAGTNQFVEAALDEGGTVLLPLAAPYVSLGPDGLDLVDPPPGLLDTDS